MLNTIDYVNLWYSQEQRRYIAKIEWFEIDFETGEIVVTDEDIKELIDGSLTTNVSQGSRRTVSLTMANDGKFIPNSNGLVWFSKGFKLYTGMILPDGTRQYNPQGMYLINSVSVTSDGAESTATINGVDIFSRLDSRLGGNLYNTFFIPAGADIYDAIKALFVKTPTYTPPINLSSDRVILNPNLKGKTAPHDFEANYGESYADLLIDIADAFSQQVYFDVNGNFIMENVIDEANITPLVHINSGESGTRGLFVDGSADFDLSQMFNQWTVVGEGLNGTVVSATAQDDNPLSPTYVGRIGIKAKTLEDSNIYTNNLCELRAKYELKKSTQLYNTANITIVPLDILKENDVVSLTNPICGWNRDKYVIQSISLPLNYSTAMSLSLSIARETIDVILF